MLHRFEYREGEEQEHDVSDFIWLESNDDARLTDIVVQTDNGQLAGLHKL